MQTATRVNDEQFWIAGVEYVLDNAKMMLFLFCGDTIFFFFFCVFIVLLSSAMQLIDSITSTGFEMKLFSWMFVLYRKGYSMRKKSDSIFRSNIKIPMNISFLCDISVVCVPSAKCHPEHQFTTSFMGRDTKLSEREERRRRKRNKLGESVQPKLIKCNLISRLSHI